jgi:hypothetical protein
MAPGLPKIVLGNRPDNAILRRCIGAEVTGEMRSEDFPAPSIFPEPHGLHTDLRHSIGELQWMQLQSMRGRP